MDNVSIFEICMLVCFGAAWPFSIIKSFHARSNKGKSILFLVIVIAGYSSGILHKYYYSWDKVIYLYIANFIMVGIDLGFYARNSLLDKKRAIDS